MKNCAHSFIIHCGDNGCQEVSSDKNWWSCTPGVPRYGPLAQAQNLLKSMAGYSRAVTFEGHCSFPNADFLFPCKKILIYHIFEGVPVLQKKKFKYPHSAILKWEIKIFGLSMQVCVSCCTASFLQTPYPLTQLLPLDNEWGVKNAQRRL